MKKILSEVKYFLLTHDDIEMFMITCVMGSVFAFFTYCIWSLMT